MKDFILSNRVTVLVIFILSTVILIPGTGSLGFRESSMGEKKNEKPAVRRIRNNPVPTELTLYFDIEKENSTKWPPLVQYIFRGSSRLPLSPETGSRLPALWFFILLALLIPVFLSRYYPLKTVWASFLIMVSSPLFIIGAKSITFDAIWIFFSSMAMLSGIFILYSKKLSWGFITLFIISFVASVFSRGVFLGGLTIAFTLFIIELFRNISALKNSNPMVLAKSSGFNFWILLFLTVLFSVLTIYALHAGASGYSSLLYTFPNPASLVPHGKYAHSLFTQHIVKAVFGFYPWSALLIVAIPMLGRSKPKKSQKSSTPKSETLIIPFGIWLVSFLMFESYYDMRIGDVFWSGILPASIITGWFITNRFSWLFKPLPALFLALFSGLLFRDVVQYPQTILETAIHYHILNIVKKPGVLVLIPLLLLWFPFGHVIYKGFRSFCSSWKTYYQMQQKEDFLFKFLIIILYPVRFIFSRLFKYLGLVFKYIHRNTIAKIYLTKNRRNIIANPLIWLGGTALITSSIISFSYMPALSLEFSTRYIYKSFSSLSSPDDELGVYKLSSRGAPVYIKKTPVNLGSKKDLLNFMADYRTRKFTALPLKSLGKFDHYMRLANIKYFMPVSSSPRYMLLSNGIKQSETDYNPLLKYIFTKEPAPKYKSNSNFEDKVILIGYEIPRSIYKGDTVTVKLYFKVLENLRANYKIFIHFDPPYGTRMTGDHYPVNDLLQTKYWTKGTYILDIYKKKIPKIGFPAGRYRIFAGLFMGSKRLKIKSGKSGGANRSPLGTMLMKSPKLFSCSGR